MSKKKYGKSNGLRNHKTFHFSALPFCAHTSNADGSVTNANIRMTFDLFNNKNPLRINARDLKKGELELDVNQFPQCISIIMEIKWNGDKWTSMKFHT